MMWGIFVSTLSSSFKNVQKRIHNQFLGLIVLIMRKADPSLLERNSLKKMFDLCQSMALLVPDPAVTVTYSNKTRNLRIILAQDLALVLHESTPLPPRSGAAFLRSAAHPSPVFVVQERQVVRTLVPLRRDDTGIYALRLWFLRL
jgi:hypothetical protein